MPIRKLQIENQCTLVASVRFSLDSRWLDTHIERQVLTHQLTLKFSHLAASIDYPHDREAAAESRSLRTVNR